MIKYKLPKAGIKVALGVYMSEATLSYVALKATSEGISVLHFGDMAIPNEGDEAFRYRELTKTIILLKNKIEKNNIVSIALPDGIATFFELSIHEPNPSLLKKHIQKEVERSIVKGSSPVIIQSESLFSERGVTRVAVTVIPEEAIYRAHKLFIDAGFKPNHIGLSSESIGHLVSPKGSELFLEINEMETSVSVLSAGSLVLQSRMQIGVADFVENLSQDLNIDSNKIRESIFFNGLDAKTGNEMLTSLRPMLRKITNEIEKMFLYWHIDCKKEKECRLNEITLFGVGSLIPGFDSYISRPLSLKVKVP